MKPSETETARIKDAYARRRTHVDPQIYSFFNAGNLFSIHHREKRVLAMLDRYSRIPLADQKILEVGCGSGFWLREFVKWGGRPENIVGIDILPDRVEEARHSCASTVTLECANAAELGFANATFDLVSQFTVFSSILDVEMKQRVAKEMLRVLKPGGVILWYDFFLDNPRNPDVRGVGRKEIFALFPDCTIALERATLAPPLARALAPLSWTTCYFLAQLRFLNTHYLAAIRRTRDEQTFPRRRKAAVFMGRGASDASKGDLAPPLPGEQGATAIQPISSEMVPHIVAIHRLAFAGYMNVKLGPKYLGAFFDWFRKQPNAVALVALTDGKVSGYVVGAPHGYRNEITRDLFSVAATGILAHPSALLEGRIRQRAWERVKGLFAGDPSSRATTELPMPCLRLVAIGVAPEFRRRGIGEKLMEAFESEARLRGARSVALSVYEGNTAARKLYERQNWRVGLPIEGGVANYHLILE